MAKKQDQSHPEHNALKEILSKIGRRKAHKKKEEDSEEKPPED